MCCASQATDFEVDMLLAHGPFVSSESLVLPLLFLHIGSENDEGFRVDISRLHPEDSKNLCVVVWSCKPRKRGWPVLNALLLLLICGWCIMERTKTHSS